MNIRNTIEYITDLLIRENPNLMNAYIPGPNINFEKLKHFLKTHHIDFQLTPFLYNDIIKSLCNKLPLYPENYEAIAFCLENMYPDIELLNISIEEVSQMIISLPNFIKQDVLLDEDLIEPVITVWIQIKENDFENDSKWDAYI